MAKGDEVVLSGATPVRGTLAAIWILIATVAGCSAASVAVVWSFRSDIRELNAILRHLIETDARHDSTFNIYDSRIRAVETRGK